jgi:hypothetical protein
MVLKQRDYVLQNCRDACLLLTPEACYLPFRVVSIKQTKPSLASHGALTEQEIRSGMLAHGAPTGSIRKVELHVGTPEHKSTPEELEAVTTQLEHIFSQYGQLASLYVLPWDPSQRNTICAFIR